MPDDTLSAGTPTPPTAAPEAPSPAASASRPDYLPESYWDATKNAVNADALKKDFNELDTLRTARDQRAALVPKDPSGYDFNALPSDFALPDGGKWQANPNDPLAQSVAKWAHANQIPQSSMPGLTAIWASLVRDGNTKHADEMKALGANASQRIDAARKSLGALLPASQASALDVLFDTKDGVEAAEALIGKLGGMRMQGQPTNGAAPKEDLSKLTGRQLLQEANSRPVRPN